MNSRSMVRRETSTLSSDTRSWLRIMMWLPGGAYTKRGIVQLVHGMSEHIQRYDEFARFLAGLGYVVFGHDHIGHGKSVSSQGELGHMPLQGGKDILVNDVMRVRDAVMEQAELPDELPFFLFGHSMGSFVVRAFMARHSERLAGVVLCGTGNQPRLLTLVGRSAARALGSLRGAEYRSHALDSLVTGSFLAGIDDPRTEYDWLSVDPSVVDAFCADPLSGSRFSAGAYATLTDTVAEAVSKKSAATVPHDLPLLFIAGEEDPVGDNGAGVEKAAQLYRDQGCDDVEVVLYPGMRHEILNEPRKLNVYSDVEAWFTRHVILREVQAGVRG